MVYSTWINQLYLFLVLICSFIVYVHSSVPRPRGVSLSKASLYSPTKDFTCFDGTVTIPFSYVNDDYCDCFDGSDEPGTSACLNGIFHCTNAGHRPQNIPSSRVNDGVCDCCDGTDEYAKPETCTNSCEELGKEAKAETLRLAELHKAGGHLRLELIQKGSIKRNEMAEQLSQLEKDKAEAEIIKAEKELLKNNLEAKEVEVLKVYKIAEQEKEMKKQEELKQINLKECTDDFERFDSNGDGLLTVDELKVHNVFDRNKDGEVDDEEAMFFLLGNKEINLDGFASETWPLLKPLLMVEDGMFKPDESQTEQEHSEGDPEESYGDLDTEYEGQENEGSDVDLPQDEQDKQELNEKYTRFYDEETQKIVDEASEARRQVTDAERTVGEIEANIRNIKENLEKDYGLQQEYITMDGQCLEYEDKEYIYKLCMFQKVTQKSKKGGNEIDLGNWGEWAGNDLNKYSVMKYTNGVACWNGPSRITIVNVNCGLETKLLSVTEPYRCEYKIELSTPAACDEANSIQEHSSHDEL